ncbi:MAG: nucleoside phosphorylase [Candidatus Methanomethyliaceae archaeon]|nr:nucleoside phosphorylase [Candidatus Methanomethyliaceae archaeon]
MYHIRCKMGEVAERVIVCGDPGRTKMVAEFLGEPKLVNENRGLLTFTGKYKDVKVTVSTTGMGTPSAAIVMEELAALGAKYVIRVGTTGGIGKDVELGDIIVPTSAVPLDGASRAYMKKGGKTVADEEIVRMLVKNLEGSRYHVGPVCTSDTFYLEEEEDASYWASRGVLSFEMECSVIFAIGSLRGYRAAAVLTVTGKIFGKGDRVIDDVKTIRGVERSIKAALETLNLIK